MKKKKQQQQQKLPQQLEQEKMLVLCNKRTALRIWLYKNKKKKEG